MDDLGLAGWPSRAGQDVEYATTLTPARSTIVSMREQNESVVAQQVTAGSIIASSMSPRTVHVWARHAHPAATPMRLAETGYIKP